MISMPIIERDLSRGQRGVAMGELAVILPVVLVVLLGIIDIARVTLLSRDHGC